MGPTIPHRDHHYQNPELGRKVEQGGGCSSLTGRYMYWRCVCGIHTAKERYLRTLFILMISMMQKDIPQGHSPALICTIYTDLTK
jgi:hypothetical protein